MIRSIVFASAAFVMAAPAAAQTAENYTGFYVGGRIATIIDNDNDSERFEFDNNLDGNFGDFVRTGTGANAFSPGFCGGRANTAVAANGCDDDKGGREWAVHAGYDMDLGGPVVGVVAEYGRANLDDSVTAFSTTPANYIFRREMGGTFGLRARIGGNVGGFLPYLTGGVVRAKIRSDFTSSNTANAFALNNSSSNEWGYRVGGGVERRFGPVALGLQYLYTSVDDEDARVAVTRGTATATNPFVRVNPNGTTLRRSDTQFDYHQVGITGSFRF